MSLLTCSNTPLDGLVVVQRQRVGDHRGFLDRLFCVEAMKAAGWCKPVAQINHTYTRKQGTVRGMHFQYPPYAEMKLIACLRGAVWDVAVDLREGSETYLQWHAEKLTAENMRTMVIPEGFAHGFQTLEENSELIYLHTASYTPSSEGGVSPHDVALGIEWPLEISEISERDSSHPIITKEFTGISL